MAQGGESCQYHSGWQTGNNTLPEIFDVATFIKIGPINPWISLRATVPGGNYQKIQHTPDSKVNGANMGPTWGRQDPGGPRVGPMNLAIWDVSFIGSSADTWNKYSVECDSTVHNWWKEVCIKLISRYRIWNKPSFYFMITQYFKLVYHDDKFINITRLQTL